MRPIDRHKTALHRDSISLPLRLAIARGLLKKEFSVFDYGCGHGDDVKFLNKNGFDAIGWDPFHFPKFLPNKKFDFVNLGYVLNVIEDLEERKQALKNADAYSDKVTLISCMLVSDMNQKISIPHNDGLLSSNNTFQKYYIQRELRSYIEEQLGTTVHALKPGVFAIIKDADLLEDFEYLNITRKSDANSDELFNLKHFNFNTFNKNKKQFHDRDRLTQSVSNFFVRHARIPSYEEFCEKVYKPQSRREFKYAILQLNHQMDDQLIKNVAEKVKVDLLQKFCLRRFIKLRSDFPVTKSLQKDIRNMFKTQKALIRASENLLFELGDEKLITEDILSAVGQNLGIFLSEKFVFHRSELLNLPLRLQTLVSLAAYLSGYENEGEIFQIHSKSKKVSILEFYDFEVSAVPKIKHRTKINLRSYEVETFKYRADKDIRIIFLKSPFMQKSDPNYTTQLKFESSLECEIHIRKVWRTWSVQELSEILLSTGSKIPPYKVH